MEEFESLYLRSPPSSGSFSLTPAIWQKCQTFTVLRSVASPSSETRSLRPDSASSGRTRCSSITTATGTSLISRILRPSCMPRSRCCPVSGTLKSRGLRQMSTYTGFAALVRTASPRHVKVAQWLWPTRE